MLQRTSSLCGGNLLQRGHDERQWRTEQPRPGWELLLSGPEISTLVHVIFGFFIAGAALFQWRAVHPAVTSEAGSAEVQESIRTHWAPVVRVGIVVLLVTGLYQFMEVGLDKATAQKEAGAAGASYHMLFGIKFLLAMGVFFIASAMVGRSEALAGIRKSASTWLGLSTLFVIGIIVISRMLAEIPASG